MSHDSDSDDEEFDPEAEEESEVGRQLVADSSGLVSVLGHFYRGEIDRVTTWRQRMDDATKWAVTVLAAVLVYGFSKQGAPEVLLAGIVVTTAFLGIESRRYQDYDAFRARVRLLQENLFAEAIDPSGGVEQRDWRRKLSDDLREPTLKIPYGEAFARRLRRVYLPLFLILLGAWLFRITFFDSGATFTERAAIGAVPGVVVLGGLVAFYLAMGWVAFRPRPRRAKEEFEMQEEPGEWKTDSDEDDENGEDDGEGPDGRKEGGR